MDGHNVVVFCNPVLASVQSNANLSVYLRAVGRFCFLLLSSNLLDGQPAEQADCQSNSYAFWYEGLTELTSYVRRIKDCHEKVRPRQSRALQLEDNLWAAGFGGKEDSEMCIPLSC